MKTKINIFIAYGLFSISMFTSIAAKRVIRSESNNMHRPENHLTPGHFQANHSINHATSFNDHRGMPDNRRNIPQSFNTHRINNQNSTTTSLAVAGTNPIQLQQQYSAQDQSTAATLFNQFAQDMQNLKPYSSFDPDALNTLVTQYLLPATNGGQLTYSALTNAFMQWYSTGTFNDTINNIANYTVMSFKAVYNLYIALLGQAAYQSASGKTIAAIPPQSQNACLLFFQSMINAHDSNISNNPNAWLDVWLQSGNVIYQKSTSITNSSSNQ